MFHSCTELTNIVLPNGITSIENYAFQGCTNLALTSLPNGITSIGNYAFYNCDNLALTNLPDAVTSIGNDAFAASNVSISDFRNVTTIGEYAFHSCPLTTLIFRKVISIGDYAFSNSTTGIASIVFNEGLTNIGIHAFESNYDDRGADLNTVSEIILPSTLQSIGYLAFAGLPPEVFSYMTYIRKATILATTPPTIEGYKVDTSGAYNVFGKGATESIVVPAGCGEAHKAAEGWSEYADKIVEAS